jgi:hypothetical protein
MRLDLSISVTRNSDAEKKQKNQQKVTLAFMWPYDQWCLQGTSSQKLEQKNQRGEIMLAGEAGRRLIFFQPLAKARRQQKAIWSSQKTKKKRDVGRRQPGVGAPWRPKCCATRRK